MSGRAGRGRKRSHSRAFQLCRALPRLLPFTSSVALSSSDKPPSINPAGLAGRAATTVSSTAAASCAAAVAVAAAAAAARRARALSRGYVQCSPEKKTAHSVHGTAVNTSKAEPKATARWRLASASPPTSAAPVKSNATWASQPTSGAAQAAIAPARYRRGGHEAGANVSMAPRWAPVHSPRAVPQPASPATPLPRTLEGAIECIHEVAHVGGHDLWRGGGGQARQGVWVTALATDESPVDGEQGPGEVFGAPMQHWAGCRLAIPPPVPTRYVSKLSFSHQQIWGCCRRWRPK